MSVENFDDPNGIAEFLDSETPEDCFYCSKPLAGITVLWHTYHSIAFHPDCAIAFAARICRDAINANCLIQGKPLLGGISESLRPKP